MLNVNFFLPLEWSTQFTLQQFTRKFRKANNTSVNQKWNKKNEKTIKQKRKERKINIEMYTHVNAHLKRCATKYVCGYLISSHLSLLQSNHCQIYHELDSCYESHKHWTALDMDLFVEYAHIQIHSYRVRKRSAVWWTGPNGNRVEKQQNHPVIYWAQFKRETHDMRQKIFMMTKTLKSDM